MRYYPQQHHEYMKKIAITYTQSIIVVNQNTLKALETVENSQEMNEVIAESEAKSSILAKEYFYNVERELTRATKQMSAINKILELIEYATEEKKINNEKTGTD